MASSSPPRGSQPHLYRPIPQRPNIQSTILEKPPNAHLGASPSPVSLSPRGREPLSRSYLDLTSSTLAGIFAPTASDDQEPEPEASSVWGVGPDSLPTTPRRERKLSIAQSQPNLYQASPYSEKRRSTTLVELALRGTTLFALGMGYGLLVRHLHDDQQVAPFQVEGIIKPSSDWTYLVFWGVAGVALGSLLPWVDTSWSEKFEGHNDDKLQKVTILEKEEVGADWTIAVRSIGAFMGIVFAIRKLAWTSTLQVSLTLLSVNPVLWYLIDGTSPGFLLSLLIGLLGTLIFNPVLFPSPAPTSSFPRNGTADMYIQGEQPALWFRRETVEGGVWVLSVLFCSCVCFGNVGRRLALRRTTGRRMVG